MRIRYIAIGIASWDNGLADILPQNLPNKLKRGKKKAISMPYRNKADLVLLDGSSFNSATLVSKLHISSMNYLQC